MRNKCRNAVHASAFLIPFLAEATSKPAVVVALGATGIVYILSETSRLRGRCVPLITQFTLAMSRDGESAHLILAPLYLAAGIALSLLVFPKSIAYASIAILAVGDPVASHVGARFGRMHVRGKTVEGFAAGLVVSFAAALIWVHPYLALLGSATGMLLELAGILDDNLTISVGAGSAMLIASML